MFNLLKTAVLMAAITALFMAIGAMIGGQTGMLLALARTENGNRHARSYRG